MNHIILAMITIGCLALPSRLIACSCMGNVTLEKSLREARAVFTGRIIAMDTVRVVNYLVHSRSGLLTSNGRVSQRMVTKLRYTLVIDTVLKGAEKVLDTLSILTGAGDCKPYLFVGATHLISADHFIEQRLNQPAGKRKRFELLRITTPKVFSVAHCYYTKMIRPPGIL